MLWAVLMAGGSGTRFWPESRAQNPKQFLRIFGRKTLLEETLLRLGRSVPPSRIFVITQQEKVVDVARLLKRVPRSQIVGEPVGRNTAPCAILAAALAFQRDPGAVIALLPADHRIEKPASFRRALQAAALIAREKKLPVTFGIRPSTPHTGYGYLELAPHPYPLPFGERRKVRVGLRVSRVARFHEKPSLAEAKSFLKTGRFLWNSGMFVWSAEALLASAKRLLPRAFRLARKITGGDFKREMARLYAGMPNISLDYGLMEKLGGKILTLPADFGWKDVGGWHSLPEILPHDRGWNVTLGKTLLVDSSGNIVKAGSRLVALVGMENHVVIDTEDALLVCPREKTEAIRKVVKKLKENKWKKYL